MILKNPKHRGKRTCIKCLNCGEEFLELNTKIKEGKGKFCSNKCYKEWRKKNSFDPKERNKLYQKKFKYNLAEDEYRNLFKEQNNKCAICGTEFNEKNKGFVDHSHITSEVRGLLCTKCNSLLGMANDDIEILKKAIEYLKDKENSFFDSINI